MPRAGRLQEWAWPARGYDYLEGTTYGLLVLVEVCVLVVELVLPLLQPIAVTRPMATARVISVFTGQSFRQGVKGHQL